MVITGKVIDKETGDGVPYATIELRNENDQYLGYGTPADQFGNFSLSTDSFAPGTVLAVSHTSYNTTSVPYSTYINNSTVQLSRRNIDLENVVVTAPKAGTDVAKKLLIGAGILAAILLLSSKKKVF